MASRDYLLRAGRPIAVVVGSGVSPDTIRDEVSRLYGGRWTVGRFVRRGRCRRVELEETGRKWPATMDWFGGAP